MTELESVHLDSCLRIVLSRNVQVNVWSSAPGMPQVRAFARTSAALARKHPRGTGLINMILHGKASFTEEVRDELVRMMRTNMYALGASHVILAKGLTGTAVRAFMSTVILLGRPVVPNKVFSEPAAAATWHVPFLAAGAEAWSTAEYAALVQKMTPS